MNDLYRREAVCFWLCLAWLVGAAGTVAAADSVRLTVPIEPRPLEIAPDAFDLAVITPEPLPGRSVDDVQWLGQIGEPRLPYQVLTIVLPANANPATVTAAIHEPVYLRLPGTWEVAPIAPAASRRDGERVVRWPADRVLSDGRDVAVYGVDAPWPSAAAHLLEVGTLRGQTVTQVAVALLRFNPQTGTLLRLVDGSIAIDFEPWDSFGPSEAPAARPSDPIARDRIQRLATPTAGDGAVGRDVDAWTAPPSEVTDPPGYIVMTTEDVVAGSTQLDAFVAHKQALGFAVEIVTEVDHGGGTGDTAAENIRAWLQDHYISHAIAYVLLIGDPDPSTGAVPMKLLHPAPDHPTPSDYYFADLSGDWDADGDGFIGEYDDDWTPTGVDRFAEVIVGRIPYYGTIADLDSILAKVIAYETEPEPAWRRNVLLPMRPSDEFTPGFQLGEAIKDDLLVVRGWPYHRIYDADFGLVPPPETVPCTQANVAAAWEAHPFGLVVWWAHGNITSASGIMSSGGAAALDDAFPAFTFQATCGNAYPENDDNLAYALLRNGAVATVGATRTSWYIIGQARFAGSPSNAGMAYEYAARLVGTRLACGDALQDLRERIYPTQMEYWKNYLTFNIYGDPSLQLLPLAARRYVDAAAPAGGDGLSWETAYNDLQDALADVPSEIWVAAGTYRPDRASGNRGQSFQLVSGVELYGGFAGGEQSLFERNLQANTTILSGDLNGDDGPAFTARDDNSYHVVVAPGVDATAVLDGFTVRGGAANDGSHDDGGGLYCTVGGSPLVRNCVFEDNLAEYGAGVRCDSESSPTFLRCIFRGNRADVYGAGYGGGLSLNWSSSPLLYNCVFVGNHASRYGGALYYRYGTVPTLINCTVALNHANNGGGIYGNNSHTDCFVTNSIFWGNTRYQWGTGAVADEAGQIMNAWGITINHSCVAGWTGTLGGTANWGGDPGLVDADGPDDVAGTADDDLSLTVGSNAIDAGDNDAIPTDQPTDITGAPRIVNGTVDLGAYEWTVSGAVDGDLDGDGDRDSDDFHAWLDCFAGPGHPLLPGCAPGDFDHDDDVDLCDLASFQPLAITPPGG